MQILCVEALCKLIVHRLQECVRVSVPALPLPKSGKVT